MHRTSFSFRTAVAVAIVSSLAAACGSGGGGGGTGGGPNTPAVASSLVVLDTKTVPARLRIVVADAESDPATVQFFYELQSARGVLVPLVGLASNPVALATSPAGTVHELPWNYPLEAGVPDDGGFAAGLTVIARVGNDSVQTIVAGIGNDAPVLTVGAVPAVAQGTVAVPFVLRDSSADSVAVKVEFRVDDQPGATWQLARPAGLRSRDLTPEFAFPRVTAPAAGAAFVFFWDTDADLTDLDRTVRVRFTPRDPVVAGAVRETPPFFVDNNGSPAATIDEAALLASGDRKNGVPIPFRISDDEGDPTRVVFQWRRQADPAFPTIDTSDLAALAVQLRDPAFRRSRQICAPYAPTIVGSVVPVDATRVRLPQLLLGEHSAALAAGIVGRDLDILRTKPAFVPLASGWSNNPLRAPVAAIAGDDGTSAFVLEEVAGAAELVEVDLAAGTIVRTLATMVGVPTAIAKACSPGRMLVATDQGGLWRLFEIEAASGVATLRAEQPGTADAGPLRGIASLGATAALATAGSSVLQVDWSAAVVVTTVRSGLAEPWGIAVDPRAPSRAFLVERQAPRLAVLELASRTLAPLGGFDLAGLVPSALAVSDDGARLGVLLRTPGITASAFVGTIELGRGAQTNVSVPADSGSVCFGPDRLVLVTQKVGRNLLARAGLEQRRRIVAFDPANAIATVATPFAPALGSRQAWRLRAVDPAVDPVASSPAGRTGSFVWDTAGVPSGEGVLVRALPLDSQVGGAAATTTAFVLRDDLQTPPLQLPTVAPRALLAADLDRDGDLDLIATSSVTSSISIFEQTSPGTFSTAPIVIGGPGVSSTLRDLEAVDIDGDGDLDLVAVSASGLLVFVQTAPGTFAAPVRVDPIGFPAGQRVVAADLDGDGDVDLATANGATAAVFFQGAAMAFGPPLVLDLAGVVASAVATDVAAGDLDGDGDVDLAVSHRNAIPGTGSSNGVVVFRQTGPQTFGQPLVLPLSREASTVRAVDVDGDGALDLVTAEAGAANGKLSVFRNGSFARSDIQVSGATNDPSDVVAADVDGDGDADLVSTNRVASKIVVLRQTAPRVFLPTALELGGPGSTDDPAAIVAADLDGDGRVDLACANEAGGTISVLLRARGRFFASTPVGVGGPSTTPQPRDVAIGDFDVDGRLDLLATGGTAAPAATIFVQQANGAFAAVPSNTMAIAGAQAAAAGDLDRDGDVDFVTANGAALSVALGRQIAPGQFTAGPLIGTASSTLWNTPTAISVGDLDADGDTDVAAVEPGAIAIVFQTSAGSFSSPPLRLTVPGAAPNPLVAPVLADVDADGDNDVVALTANAIVIWRQVALGSFSAATTLPVPGFGNTPRALAVADFDGDGLVDLVAANDLDVAVFRQGAPGSFGLAVVLPGAGNDSVAALDFDHDGDADLACVRGGQLVLVPQVTPLVFGEPRVVGGAGLGGLRVADVDGDGDVDVVAVDALAQRVVVFFGGR